MDLRSRRKLAFVVERYGAEEAGEAGRRTRAIAAALADRGHDVSVLTTCARTAGTWRDELAEGETSLDGVRLLRFKIDPPPKTTLLERLHALGRRLVPRDRQLAEGPSSASMETYLARAGTQFDAVFFSGGWGPLAQRGAVAVGTPVIAPPPVDDPSRSDEACASLLGRAKAVAYAFRGQEQLFAEQVHFTMPSTSTVIGACQDPGTVSSSRFVPPQPVSGPFILLVGLHTPATDRLVAAFRAFREAHATTPFENDIEGAFEGRDLRLLLAGDFGHPHLPQDRVLGIGPVDEQVRRSLMQAAIAVVHADPSAQLPMSLIEAWSMERPSVVAEAHPALGTSAGRLATSYASDATTFPSTLAALLAARAPRKMMAAELRAHARQAFSAVDVVRNVETLLDQLRAAGGT